MVLTTIHHSNMWKVVWIRVHFVDLIYIISHYFYCCMTKKGCLLSSETLFKHFLSFDIRMSILTIAVSIDFVQGSNKIIDSSSKLINICIGTDHCKKSKIPWRLLWPLMDQETYFAILCNFLHILLSQLQLHVHFCWCVHFTSP